MIDIELTGEAGGGFAKPFREAVDNALRRTGKLKKQLASDCGMRADRFSHLQSGSRKPTYDEVLKIGHGLRLDGATVDGLLVAAGYPRQALQPGQAPDGPVLVRRLGEPERGVARAEIDQDMALVRSAWDHYVGLQSDVEAHEWERARAGYDKGIDLYWRLRAMAARFLAQVNLAAAAAEPHLNRLVEAEAKCVEGIQAAEIGRSRPFEIMLLTRHASIKRLRSDYGEAARLYDRALSTIDAWTGEDSRDSPGYTNRQAWRAHWTARIQRIYGVLELFKGNPTEAMHRLKPSLEHFKNGDHLDELAQVYYGLGWANGLLGHLERAASYDQQGLSCAQRHNQVIAREDDRALLQGHLYLGGDFLDLGELPDARTHLEEAAKVAQHEGLRPYHEVGRVHLLRGELEMKSGALDHAFPHLQTGLEFFSSREEQGLLSAAHNYMGDYYLLRGGADIPRALMHYSRALRAARSCRPPNPYYECAALLNMCRIRIQHDLPAPERAHQDPPEVEWDVDGLLGQARALARAHGYRNHRGRLALLEAESALKRGDRANAERAAVDASAIAHNFSAHLLGEVRSQLRRMGLPDLTDAPVAAPDES